MTLSPSRAVIHSWWPAAVVWGVVFPVGILAQAPVKELRTAAEVRGLTVQEAQQRIPVRLRRLPGRRLTVII